MSRRASRSAQPAPSGATVFEDPREELGESEEEEEEEAPATRGRRPGKEPVDDYMGPSQPGARSVGRKRRSAAGGGGGGGFGSAPAKRVRPDGPPRVKSDPGAADASFPVTRMELQRAENTAQNYEMAASGLAAQATAVMTQAGLDALARAVVRHMLFRNAELPGVPVPRADVTKLVAGAHRRAGAYVVALAQHMMVQCFGLEMKELDKPPARGARGAAAAAAAAAAGQGTKQFVLRSLVPEKLHAGVVREPCGDAARGFLGVVLALAEVSGGGVGVDALWRHLGDMGVAAEREHPRLGKPAALLEQLVKKRYLHRERVVCNDGEEVTYWPAENAADEFGDGAVKAWRDAEFAAAAAVEVAEADEGDAEDGS